MNKEDTLFANPMKDINDFDFDETVADVFPDMIKRSVPGYETIISTISELASQFVTAGSNVYDLGCSLGAASFSVARGCKENTCEIHAIDSSDAMVERGKRLVNSFNLPNPININKGLAQHTKISNASMVIMNFTLQFINPEEREPLLKNICEGLNNGGVFILSEKIRHPSIQGNKLLIDLHHQFKRSNGYSELEISQKRAALENVMLTDTFSEHEQRLKQAGFNEIVMWYKCYNFMSLIAIKNN